MIATLGKMAKTKGVVLGRIIESPHEAVIAIVKGWPTAADGRRAKGIGITADRNTEDAILHYLEDFQP